MLILLHKKVPSPNQLKTRHHSRVTTSIHPCLTAQTSMRTAKHLLYASAVTGGPV